MIWKKKRGVRWHWQRCSSQGRRALCGQPVPCLDVGGQWCHTVHVPGRAHLSLGPPNPGSALAPLRPGSWAGTAKRWWQGTGWTPWAEGVAARGTSMSWVANWKQSSGGGRCGERCKGNFNKTCCKCRPVRAATLRGQHCLRWPRTRVNTFVLVMAELFFQEHVPLQ